MEYQDSLKRTSQMSFKGDVMVDFYFLRCDKVARENRGYCKVSQQLTATLG